MKLTLKGKPQDEALRQRLEKFLYENQKLSGVSVKNIEPNKWLVKDKYTVSFADNGFTCTCPDFRFRRKICKHIFAVLVKEELPNKATALFLGMPELLKAFQIKK
jgi:hypothetical protein